MYTARIELYSNQLSVTWFVLLLYEQVIQGRQSINRDLRTMQKKHHCNDVRLRGALQKIAEKHEELRQARKIIVVRPLRGEEQDQSEDEEMVGEISC